MNLVTDPDLGKRLDQERDHAKIAKAKLDESIRKAKNSWTPFIHAVAQLAEVKEPRGFGIMGRSYSLGGVTRTEWFCELCSTRAIGVFLCQSKVRKDDADARAEVTMMLARRGPIGFWRKKTRVEGTFVIYNPNKWRARVQYSAYEDAVVPEAGIFHEDELQQLYDAMIVETVELHQKRTDEITRKAAEVQLLNFGA